VVTCDSFLSLFIFVVVEHCKVYITSLFCGLVVSILFVDSRICALRFCGFCFLQHCLWMLLRGMDM
jgi:hypothetical protein